MNKPRVCAVITGDDPEAARDAEPLVDLYEVRIDLIGAGWRRLASRLKKPWIACNRMSAEGGAWRGGEKQRIEELLGAVELGAETVDIELRSRNLPDIVGSIKSRASCLISFHDFTGTPPLEELKETVRRQVESGADICKVVTTAHSFDDNLTVLRLLLDFPAQKMVSFAMGETGTASRILSPLAGGYFTYASLKTGSESAAGQVTVWQLKELHGLLESGA